MTNRPDRSLDNAAEQKLIDYYQSQQLSNDRLHEILTDTHTYNRNRYIGYALAASVAVMFLFSFAYKNILASQRTDTVLREAALNHSSKLRMDAETESLTELQSKLAELGFEIKLPESEFFQKLALIGGRYCTISGNLAAHIKLSDPETSEQYSLFLTPFAENLKSMHSPTVEIAGVDVDLWQENNVVYAFASGVSE